MIKLSVSFLLISLLFPFGRTLAQSPDFKKEWRQIEQYEQEGLIASARTETMKVFKAASDTRNDAQQIKALIFLMRYNDVNEENSTTENFRLLDSLILLSKCPARNILYSIQAERLQRYMQANRYRIYGRSRLSRIDSLDFETWDASAFQETISTLYSKSLNPENTLQNITLDNFQPILEEGKNTRHLRPTLYDLLAHRALDFFSQEENDIVKPASRFLLNNPDIFSRNESFAEASFTGSDTLSSLYKAVQLLQKLTRFHITNNQKAALADLTILRLNFGKAHGSFLKKELLYEMSLLRMEADPFLSDLQHLPKSMRAALYAEQGNRYNRYYNVKEKWKLKAAALLCDSVISSFPNSEGGIACSNLIQQIRSRYMDMQTEHVYLPAQPIKALVSYKNIDRVYIRIFKTSPEEINLYYNRDAEFMKAKLFQNKPDLELTLNIPGETDHQNHSTEIKIDPLPLGHYFLLASAEHDFSTSDNILTRQPLYISNISTIHNNREYYVLHRETGMPMANADIQVWINTYDAGDRSYHPVKAERYVSDKDGHFTVTNKENYRKFSLDITSGNDRLFIPDNNFWSSDVGKAEIPASKTTFLFTDRSIYRPGQTVYFKGIVTGNESGRNIQTAQTGFRTTIELMNVNYEKVGQFSVVTNGYGSFSGIFKLPEGVLNGQFTLRDSVTKSMAYIQVEEYKRPTFHVILEEPKGSYRLNDSVLTTGQGFAYSGANMNDAKVKYRVTRKTIIPFRRVRYGIWPPYDGHETEICNGETTTDNEGRFHFAFSALSDEGYDETTEPSFLYEISAEVTDVNGETRNATQILNITKKALTASLSCPDKMAADSIGRIKAFLKNMSGQAQSIVTQIKISKLQSSGYFIRSRYWDTPSDFLLNREEFKKYFPSDPYENEDRPEFWPEQETILTWNTSTSENGDIQLPAKKKMASAWYKISMLAVDSYGDTIKTDKVVFIYNKKYDTDPQTPISMIQDDHLYAPGDTARISLLTPFDKIYALESITYPSEESQTRKEAISSKSVFNKNISIKESDYGGINIGYVIVKNNRTYSIDGHLPVPWQKKQLQIVYETFRDKLKPGSTEHWKVSIKGYRGEKVAAEMLASMYDASLDAFKSHDWNSLQTLWSTNNSRLIWSPDYFQKRNAETLNYYQENPIREYEKIYDALIGFGQSTYYYRKGGLPILMAADKSEGVSEVRVTGIRKEDASLNTKEGIEQELTIDAKKKKAVEPSELLVRKNFNETAFFFPDLQTDLNGSIIFSFTIPEALTQWRLLLLAHTGELSSAYSEKMTRTEKDLMLQANAPRFIRQGDHLEFPVKISNKIDQEIKGKVILELFDLNTDQSVDGWFRNIFPVQFFSIEAGKSISLSFPFDIPFTYTGALGYRIRAISENESFSDGESAAIPILSNRILVTETMPMFLKTGQSKSFNFQKLLTSDESPTLTHRGLTIEFTPNPIWYAVQALPYIIENPYECTEQRFNRFFANEMASYTAAAHPRLRQTIEQWIKADTNALRSNLQKNEELKQVLLQETPWVLEAKNENEEKKNIEKLLDSERIEKEQQDNIQKLKKLQLSNGGFCWLPGGQDDRYMTQYIMTGMGRLQKTGRPYLKEHVDIKQMITAALTYCDKRLQEEYDYLLKMKVDLSKNNLSHYAIQYLYMRSFFTATAIEPNCKKSFAYFLRQAEKHCLKENKYMQAMIALALYRYQRVGKAKQIINALQQQAVRTEEDGMYWKALAKGGYYWDQASIEGQAQMIEAFEEIQKNKITIDAMKIWLLKNKQTNHWGNTKATSAACYALLLSGSPWLDAKKSYQIQSGSVILDYEKEEAGTGYVKEFIPGDKVSESMGKIKISQHQSDNTASPAWGAAYWQYFEDADKITEAATPLQVKKQLWISKNSANGPYLKAIEKDEEIHIGDKVKVRMEIRADRDMEYIHMKDMRAACLEPDHVISEYKYQGGLGYYESTRDASSHFFFAYLPKGTYIFEYEVHAAQAGSFSNGITTIECMYAPEFSSHSEGIKISVAP